MTEQLDLEIIEGYRKELAAPLAALFNAWDELWPGSFLQGVPATPERVDREYGSQRAIMMLIAWDKAANEAVGFCSLLPHWRDSEAAYIGVLGVAPQVLGKKVGKRLLLRSLQIATQKGYQRLDLHTWAGNLKAMPLYKKIGLMWDPEGRGVHLRGFIPAILQHPLCAPFFAAHGDGHAWYNTQQRDLTQAPDDMKREGMQVYTYEFRTGDDRLEVIVDRHASAISGVDCTVDGRRLKVNARLTNHTVFCGIPSEYILEFENGSNDTRSVSVQLEGFAGLHFNGGTKHALMLSPNGSTSIRVPFYLASSAPLFRRDFKSPTITAKLKIDGKSAQLHTGMKIQPAAEIQTQFGRCRMVSGGKVTFPITIKNNSSLPLEGTIQFHLPKANLTVTPLDAPVKMKSEGLTGVTLEISAGPDLPPGAYDIWASLHLKTPKHETLSVTTRKFRIPIFNIPDGHVAISEDDRQRELLAVSKDYCVQLAREGGTVTLSYTYALGSSLFLLREIGPPFGINPFRFAEQDIKVERGESSTIATLSANHFDRPLRIETRVLFDHHSPVILQEIWAENLSSEPHTFQLRLIGPGGISVEGGKTIIPLKSGIIEDRVSSFTAAYPAIPGTPEGFKETWVAAELHALTRGQVWHPDNVEEIRIVLGRIIRLSYRPFTLAPHETQCLSKIWYVAKAQSWKAVRQTWQEKVDHHLPSEREVNLPLETSPIVNIAPPPLLIPYSQTIQREYPVQYIAGIPQSGQYIIEPPSGWKATISQIDGKNTNSRLFLDNITISNNPVLHLTLTPSQAVPDEFAIYHGTVIWQTPVEERQTFPIVQLGSSGKSVEIAEEEDQELMCYRVSNGVLEFKVSPNFGGTLYSIKNASGTELLQSAFPTPSPKLFLQNYYGGWQHFVSAVEDDPFQATTNQEKMRAVRCQVGDAWHGVEVRWKGKLQACCRGVDFRLQYLTAAGSPLILCNWKIRNATTAPLRLLLLQGIDAAFDSDLSKSIIQSHWGGSPTTIRGSPVPAAFSPDTNIGWLRHGAPETHPAEGIAYLNAGTQPNMLIFVTHEVNWLFSFNDLFIHPKEDCSVRSALFVNPPTETHLETIQKLLNDFL